MVACVSFMLWVHGPWNSDSHYSVFNVDLLNERSRRKRNSINPRNVAMKESPKSTWLKASVALSVAGAAVVSFAQEDGGTTVAKGIPEKPPTEEPAQPGEKKSEGAETLDASDRGAIRNRPNARVMTLSIPAPRGPIVDRYGRPLAQNKVVWYPALQYQQFEKDDRDFVVKWGRKRIDAANQVFGTSWNPSDEELWQHYRHRRWMPMPYTFVVEAEKKKELEGKLMDGLILHPLYQRHYPQKESAAHIIGYTGKKGELEKGPINYGDPIFPFTLGRSGLEKIFDDHLSGRPGLKRLQFDSDGTKYPEEQVQRPRPGGTLVTTIDLRWQLHAEKVLEKHCKRGALVILDVKTGEVLVMASRPSYDLNAFVPFITTEAYAAIRDHKDKPLFSRAFQAEYPPASTFKIMTAAAGLHYGVIDPYTLVNCPAFIEVGNHKFNNWSKKAEEPMAVSRAIARSNNPFFYQVGHGVRSYRFIDMAKKFGYGQTTGLPLVGEKSGNMPDEAWMLKHHKRRFNKGDDFNNAIGQGVLLATPLQVAQGMAGVANNGYLPKLHLVRQMQDVRGRVLKANKPETRIHSGVSPANMFAIQEGMMKVVNSSFGTARSANLSFAMLCGKTGTAQWGNPDLKQGLAWFAGYFPFENPRFAFAAVYEGDPHEKVSGGRKAAPIVKAFFEPIKEEVKSLIAPPAKAQVVVAEVEDKPPVVELGPDGQPIPKKAVEVGQELPDPENGEPKKAVPVIPPSDGDKPEVPDEPEVPKAEPVPKAVPVKPDGGGVEPTEPSEEPVGQPDPEKPKQEEPVDPDAPIRAVPVGQ